MGKILSPRHTLPPNTTCTYYFHGQPGDLVWLSFTSYHLQMLQHIIQDNSTVHRSELPPWIIRLRMWDSIGTYKSEKTLAANGNNTWPNADQNATDHKYYYSPSNPIYGKKTKVNIDNVWNPVDNYIYDRTPNSVFNQENKFSSAPIQVTPPMMPTRPAHANMLDNIKDPLSYLAKLNKMSERERERERERDHSTVPTASAAAARQREREAERVRTLRGSQNRKLIVELYDNETPRLCDHNLLEDNKKPVRPCSPMESYLSTSKDMVSY